MGELVTKDQLFSPSEKYTWEKWLERIPWEARQTALKYPPGTKFFLHEKIMHLISYDENGGMCVTAIDPSLGYEKAVATMAPICKCCLPKLDSLKIVKEYYA